MVNVLMIPLLVVKTDYALQPTTAECLNKYVLHLL